VRNWCNMINVRRAATRILSVPTMVWGFTGLAGCSGTGKASALAPGTNPKVVAVYESRCGSCHVPVEPGTRTREQLSKAFVAHRKRVRLGDLEWEQLIRALTQLK